MPRLSDEQVRQLRELAGMPDAEASVAELIGAVRGRLAERNRQLASPERRDTVIEAAIGAGKFTEARRGHYRRLWDQDPTGAEATIASLAPLGSASAAATSGEVDAEFSHLWPPDFRPYTAQERQSMLVGPSREQEWERQDAAMAAEAAARPAAEPGLTDDEYRQLFGPD